MYITMWAQLPKNGSPDWERSIGPLQLETISDQTTMDRLSEAIEPLSPRFLMDPLLATQYYPHSKIRLPFLLFKNYTTVSGSPIIIHKSSPIRDSQSIAPTNFSSCSSICAVITISPDTTAIDLRISPNRAPQALMANTIRSATTRPPSVSTTAGRPNCILLYRALLKYKYAHI